MTGLHAVNDEHTFDTALAAALLRRNPRRRTDGAPEAEPVGALPGGWRPDLLLRESGGSPVVIETEFRPAATVERDARSRLGETITDGDAPPRPPGAVSSRRTAPTP